MVTRFVGNCARVFSLLLIFFTLSGARIALADNAAFDLPDLASR